MDNELLDVLSRRLLGEPFPRNRIYQQIMHDGGLDLSTFTEAQFRILFSSEYHEVPGDTPFCLTSLLAYYVSYARSVQHADQIDRNVVISWVYALLAIGGLCQKGFAEWEFVLDLILESLLLLQGTLQSDERLRLLKAIIIPE